MWIYLPEVKLGSAPSLLCQETWGAVIITNTHCRLLAVRNLTIWFSYEIFTSASLCGSPYSLSRRPANGRSWKIQLTNGRAAPIFNLPMAAHGWVRGWHTWCPSIDCGRKLVAREVILTKRNHSAVQVLLLIKRVSVQFLLAGFWLGGSRPWP